MRHPFTTVPAGACIGVVAPAGPADAAQVALVEPLLARWGWRTKIFPGCLQASGYLAGPDDVRLADLHAAFADPEVHTIVCLRGGYGAMRLLDRIDAAHLLRHRKLLVGYSDITALHALLDRAGLPSLHGPMLASDLVRDGHADDAQALARLLREGLRAGTVLAPPIAPVIAPDALRIEGRAEGRLVGGNLSLVACLLGTPWAWRMEGAILFLEDVNEEPYKVDRLLCQLRLCGALQVAAGFVIGSFSEQASPHEVLDHYLRPLGKPVLGGWPSGHGTPNRPLPLGVHVALDSACGTLTLRDDLIVPA
jgi:muramoyltetrapeptide carboxypeptidase